MNIKPDEAQLIAYLYGELVPEEMRHMEETIAKSPELAKELDEMREVLGILKTLPDKEVIEPVIVHEKKAQVPYLRTMLAVAASISLIILIGYVTDLKIQLKDNQFVVQFGETSEQPQQNEVQDALKNYNELAASMVADNRILRKEIDSLKVRLVSYENIDDLVSGRIDFTLDKNLRSTQQKLDEYASQLQKMNQEAVLTLLDQSYDEQKYYINALLTDYADYLEGRRQQDIQFYIDGLNKIKEDQEQKQIQTQQILASLITTNGQTLPGKYQAGSK